VPVNLKICQSISGASITPLPSNSIVFFGDSQTEFFDLPEFFKNNLIINRGIASDRTDQLLSRIDQITNGKPKKVFFQAGVNDLCSNISVDSCFLNFKKIILSIKKKSPTTKIYYQNIFPFEFVLSKIIKLNTLTESFCKENNIVYIDLFSEFCKNNRLNPDYDCGDGLHLSGNGYLQWKNLIEKYVNE
jgi:lysophospholipase L1-like esterase